MLTRILRSFPRIRICRSPAGEPAGTIVLFPVSRHRLPCGLAGIVEVVRDGGARAPDTGPARRAVSALPRTGLESLSADAMGYAGGDGAAGAIERLVEELRRPECFPVLCRDGALREDLVSIAGAICEFAASESAVLDAGENLPALAVQEEVNRRLVRLRDAAWAIEKELIANVSRVLDLVGIETPSDKAIREYRKVNLILNSLDRLEIRGRDSAGILLQAHFPAAGALSGVLAGHEGEVRSRTALEDLPDTAVAISDDGRTATFVYKVAAEVGRLGDNVAYLRGRVAGDALLRAVLTAGTSQVAVTAHTRWASNGIINIANCHPLDNDCAGETSPPELHTGHLLEDRVPRVHVALNGDIDNYRELKERFEVVSGRKCSERITTDAKVIALWIDHYLREGEDVANAFRRAVADFEGSAAILMTSDLDPGRLYLSLKGSGQSLYVGLGSGGYVVASELYGLVEETARFVKLDGEVPRVPGDARTLGQILILDPELGGTAGIRALSHDGGKIDVTEASVRIAEITTRDVDRGDFQHYFLKEVAQSSASVAKTLRGKFTPDGRCLMDRQVIPDALATALRGRDLERIAVVGQGTASVAAMAVAAFIGDSLRGSGIPVVALKASELSGFELAPDMTRTLVIAVTQSGATADTNRAVDLAKERGAHTLAIVNRRNSDITFKTAGVLYTSDGRDVEMSVASTKAFYSQVVAGAVLGLAFGELAGTQGRADIRRSLEDLRRLPDLLTEVFALAPVIEAAAVRLAPSRRHWTVVGSGPNRIAAEEVRIKLSELCYKSISADSVEDKKHIDLSSESLILVLAAGHEDSVALDLVKDVAIFRAHRALPVVFTTRGDRRFDEYAEAVIELPPASPLLSMVMCTMAGHLFGYHAACSIDEGGRFLGKLRSIVVESLDDPGTVDLAELGRYQRQFRERLRRSRFSSSLEAHTAADLIMLLKYAAGELPPASFREEFGRNPRAADIRATLLEHLVDAVDQTLRPIDAIKHQAKIVTVGTSRISDRPEGILFDALSSIEAALASVTVSDRMFLAQIQPAVERVTGVTRYVVEDAGPSGQPTSETRIRVTQKHGEATKLPSRAEGGAPLKGTKRTVVKSRRIFVGVGAKDGQRIVIVPLVDPRFNVEALALLHLEFKVALHPGEKRRVLGDRYDEILNGVTEADIPWTDDLLEPISPEEIVTQTSALIVERIIQA